MNFGEAIEALKQDKKVARSGWNGKNMWLFMNRGRFDADKVDSTLIDGVSTGLFDPSGTDTTMVLPHLCMVAASGSLVTGWLASQTDILAEDWQTIE